MELVLWRHADAEDGENDAARKLTRKGAKQARRIGRWLDKHLPEDAMLIVSPTARTRETAEALERPQRIEEKIAPGASARALLQAAG